MAGLPERSTDLAYMNAWVPPSTLMPHDESVKVEHIYLLCLDVLRQTCTETESSPTSQISTAMLRNEVAKLSLWGEDLDLGTIDASIRQSQALLHQLLETLVEIGYLAIKAFHISHSDTLEKSPIVDDLTQAVLHGRQLTVSTQENGEVLQDGIEDSDSDESSVDIELDTLSELLGVQITCLLEMSPIIEQHVAEFDTITLLKPQMEPAAVSGPAHFYSQLLLESETYNKADRELLQRLGNANGNRHQDLRETSRYQERRAGRSTDNLQESEAAMENVTQTFKEKKLFHDSGLGLTESGENRHFSVAKSYASGISSGVEDHDRLRMPPPPPEVAEGKPFRCPYCLNMQFDISNRTLWKKHVFYDLRPYICTLGGCSDQNTQFSTREAWVNHEFTQHRHDEHFLCSNCTRVCDRFEDWRNHVLIDHNTDPVLLGKLQENACQLVERPMAIQECFLCREFPANSKRDFARHCARHMESISLMALPPSDYFRSDEALFDSDDSEILGPLPDFHIVNKEGGIVDRAPEQEEPIKSRDAVGRKFFFPFQLCNTWSGMEFLINEAFENIDGLRKHVTERHYDLLGPHGEIILPHFWDSVVEPDMTVTMLMWPMAEGKEEKDARDTVIPPHLEDEAETNSKKKQKKKKKPLPRGFMLWGPGKPTQKSKKAELKAPSPPSSDRDDDATS